MLCYHNNKPWITKDLKKTINEKKFIFAQGNIMTIKLKQKELRKEIIKCREIYKKKIESHFRQGNIKETWSGIKKITGYLKPKSPFPPNIDLKELNQFHTRFDTIDLYWEQIPVPLKAVCLSCTVHPLYK